MFNIVKKEIVWGGKTVSIETGRIARQAGGAVLARMGNTVVLCTTTMAKQPTTGIDFVPLTVSYIEKAYAAGKVPGGFFKRESRPSENETLTSRLIDRPIRPLFPSNFHYETQVVCMVVAYEAENDPALVAMFGASAALSISKAPIEEAIAAARVGYADGEYILNPDDRKAKDSQLDLVVAGTESSVLMVESEARELSEDVMLGAVEFGHKAIQPIITMIKEFAAEAGTGAMELNVEDTSALKAQISDFAKDKIAAAYSITKKQDRVDALETARKEIIEKFVSEEVESNLVSDITKKLEKEIVRGSIITTGKRIDGRGTEDVRPISVEIDVLPQVHGSALFTRGETQALVVTTLGTSQDEQMIDGLDLTHHQRFMLHYNFPGYSVGEVSRMGPVGRRELGHGKLALRALKAVIPGEEEFPYSVRVVSEITESNGSSSMATVCGASLSLMSTGVPIKKAVSGIAMGLIKEGDKHVVLSDIMGDEDHLGDMDFKVAGTVDGITALQMDIKCNGVSAEIMKTALDQAKRGRAHIMGKMNEVISESKKELSLNVPQMESIKISPDKIREVIGSRGKVIKSICEESGATVDIEDDGTVKISGSSKKVIDKAIEMINAIILDPQVGDIYDGKVVKIIDSGAFVNIMGSKDGFVHISELADYRVDFVDDVLNEGDTAKVKVIGFDKKGRAKLSYRAVDQATGEDISGNIGGGEEDGNKSEGGSHHDHGDKRHGDSRNHNKDGQRRDGNRRGNDGGHHKDSHRSDNRHGDSRNSDSRNSDGHHNKERHHEVREEVKKEEEPKKKIMGFFRKKD